MNKRVIRAGIAGSGFAAKFHYEALLRVFSANVDIAGVYSVTQNKLQEFTSVRHLNALNSIDDLIDSSDVIHICTPPATHESIVIAALQKHRHVIVEKPFTGYFGNDSESFNGDIFQEKKV